MDEPNAWTEDELRILREMWPCHTVREISERIPGRTPQACLTKGLRIGLPRRPHRGGKGEPWTPEEDATVAALYGDEGAAGTAARLPGRTPAAVANRVRRLGLVSKHYRRWTPEEDALLIRWYGRMGAGRMLAEGMLPGRDVDAVMHRANLLGVRRLTVSTWTAREDEAIRACIPGMLALPSPDARLIALRRLSRAIGREERHVASRMRRWLREEAA